MKKSNILAIMLAFLSLIGTRSLKSQSTIQISGKVTTMSNEAISGANVLLTGTSSATARTDANGYYSFEVNNGGNYALELTGVENTEAGDGISTVDIALLRRHILTMAPLDNPYKIIGGDVNFSNSVTTVDCKLMQDVILKNKPDFSGNSWVFVPSAHVFGDDQNPFPYPSTWNATALGQNATVDFIAIKLGDINNSLVLENNGNGDDNFPSDEGKDTIWVSNINELMQTPYLTQEGNKVVLIRDGVYNLTDRLTITGNNVIFRSESENRQNVVLRGEGMEGGVGFVFSVVGKNIAIKDLSLGEVSYHGIQVHGEHNADSFYVQNVRFYDIREQMLKGSADLNNPLVHADYGVVEDCLFEYTAGQAFQYYCGGVDVHAGNYWRISNCTFKNIYSPETHLSEGGVHFWSNSEGTIVENCTLINCDRGIMFGLDDSYHYGGIIRNNMIHVTRDVGIYLCWANGAKVYNNTVYNESDYPNSIEYRFEQTTDCDIINNLTNKAIRSRNNSVVNVNNNITNAESAWFINASQADLHLKTNIQSVVNQAVDLDDVKVDFDGDIRPLGQSDIGADEM